MHYKVEQLMPYLVQDPDQDETVYSPPGDRIILAQLTVGEPDSIYGVTPETMLAEVEAVILTENGPIVAVTEGTDGYEIVVNKDGLDNVKFLVHEVVVVIG